MYVRICDSEFDHVSLYKADLPLAPYRNGNNGVTFQMRQKRYFQILTGSIF